MDLTRLFIADSYYYHTNKPFLGYDGIPNVDCQICKSSLKFHVSTSETIGKERASLNL